ncbi:MAG TPA: class I SAM-dependent methyltransferase [Chitinophagaceae bacterium]|nr:class I SAM-dependent methyltransferase [Chitinophagaceae bacterium]
MIAPLFLKLTEFPAFRRIIWKPVYETIAKKIKAPHWHFMNYGYVPFPSEETLWLHREDEINRYSIQLYHYLISKVDVIDKDILEVGSGRGGGSAYINKYLKPKMIIGLDIAHNAIKLANENHSVKSLKFVQGSAENLPFPDETFDVVINVESCHAYGSVQAFLKEVKRVLRPGGYLLCTDMRSPNGMKTLKNNLLGTGMRLAKEEVITENVITAIEHEENMKQKRISENIPKWLLKAFKEFAGVKGSQIHMDLKNGSLVYHRFILQKDYSNK